MALFTARINVAVDAALAGITHAQLHTGDPGAAGTSNVAPGVARATITLPAAAGGDTTDTVTFEIPTSGGGPYDHVSLWSAADGGTCYGTGLVTPAETYAADGPEGRTLLVTLTVTGS